MATKKVTKVENKVETPIDQRETFVSLQHHFGESKEDVAEKLRMLFELQQADSEIDKIKRLSGELPVEVDKLEGEIADMKAKLTQLNSVIDAYNQTIEDNKETIVNLDKEIDNYKKQQDQVENSREFDSIGKEIENEDLLRRIAKKTIDETLAAIDNKKAEISDLKKEISVRNDDLKAKKEELANIEESTAENEKKLQQRREDLAKQIDPRTMSAYERIRASVHNHLAVVTVYNNDSCGGCFSTITPQRLIDIQSNTKLVICEHCGRIIVNPDFDGSKEEAPKPEEKPKTTKKTVRKSNAKSAKKDIS